MEERALYKITQGLYVLSCVDGDERFVGCTVDAVMQASFKPTLVAISCLNTNYTRECIEKKGEFGLSVLGKDVDPFIVANFGFQSGRTIDKWNNVKFYVEDGLPYVEGNIATIKATVLEKKVFESHTMFIAEVCGCKNNRDADILTYTDYRDYFKTDVLDAMEKFKAKQA